MVERSDASSTADFRRLWAGDSVSLLDSVVLSTSNGPGVLSEVGPT
jgi:hypothetical protein